MSDAAVRRDPRTWLAFVKFEHTLFALPFAYTGMVLAAGGWPGAGTFALVTLAMVGARTAAMAINRVVDAEIDARNPRTAAREIPAGRLTRRDGLAVAALGVVAFTAAGLALNPLTAALLPVAVAFLVAYPYTKRVTWACHLWLGVTIGAAAAGGVIAVTGAFDAGAVALWIGVGAWIAGFDVIYGLLDRDVDLREGIRSIPVRFGPDRALDVAAALHAVALAAFVTLAFVTPLGTPYLVAVLGLVAPLLGVQQGLVRRRGAAAALQAFNANLWVSGLVLAAVVFDVAVAAGAAW
ncbi:MAG: 4-hydroxybenzoate octaprenyltransferase [Trueperaceae bacterium]|nr:4-hydroxybenzoate octaprenyltransferase [Trueperaceae bacterium]